MSALKELFQSSTHEESGPGFCPCCGAKVVMRERRLNGDDVCAEGCRFPSKDAVVPLRDVRLTKDKE